MDWYFQVKEGLSHPNEPIKELHHVGQQCSDPSCRQLDYLPTPCPYCNLVFCESHYGLLDRTQSSKPGHDCQKSHLKIDRKALICPLCSQVVPVSRLLSGSSSGDPNESVNRHIEAGCPKEAGSTTGRAFSNVCSVKGCSKKELVPIVCSDCGVKHCIRHRLPADHSCPGYHPFSLYYKRRERDSRDSICE
jgi:predicted nucleic acid binding AN1-type Zn finger protein